MPPPDDHAMLRFTTTGTPFARGEQQGRACRELVLPWFQSQLAAASKIGKDPVESWLARIRNVAPQGVEECRGIAAGLGLGEGDYFRVLFGFLTTFPQCTTCGIRNEKGEPLLAKTDDLFVPELGKNVLETTIPDQGYRHAHFHFAGSIWTVAGMNERGLAIAMTGIPGPALEVDGLSFGEALHTILPLCATVGETLTHLKTLPMNHYGFSLLIGDASGEMTLIEKTGLGLVMLPPNNGAPLIHTNHILDPDFARRNPPQAGDIHKNGSLRYATAMRRAGTLARTEEGLGAFVSDRSPTGPICQQGEDTMFTDFAVVFSPVEKRFTFWPGPPAITKSETVRLDSFFR